MADAKSIAMGIFVKAIRVAIDTGVFFGANLVVALTDIVHHPKTRHVVIWLISDGIHNFINTPDLLEIFIDDKEWKKHTALYKDVLIALGYLVLSVIYEFIMLKKTSYYQILVGNLIRALVGLGGNQAVGGVIAVVTEKKSKSVAN